MDIFGELGVGSVLYIGGNDSMDTYSQALALR